MVRIEFDLDSIFEETAVAIIAMLEKRFPGAKSRYLTVRVETTAVPTPSEPSMPSVPSVEGGTVEATAEPQPEAKRRGRPRKDAQPEVPAVDPTAAQSGPAEGAAPSAELPSQSAPAGETGPKSYTLDELRSGLQTYTGKHDLVKAKALLKSFGCDRITELAEKGPEVHRQFMKECEA